MTKSTIQLIIDMEVATFNEMEKAKEIQAKKNEQILLSLEKIQSLTEEFFTNKLHVDYEEVLINILEEMLDVTMIDNSFTEKFETLYNHIRKNIQDEYSVQNYLFLINNPEHNSFAYNVLHHKLRFLARHGVFK